MKLGEGVQDRKLEDCLDFEESKKSMRS